MLAHRSRFKTPADELFQQFSPDGRWIAYRSDESGTNEIWVRRFPGAGSRFQISDGGGIYVFWSKTRHELFYEALDHRIMVVDYREESVPLLPPSRANGQSVKSSIRAYRTWISNRIESA